LRNLRKRNSENIKRLGYSRFFEPRGKNEKERVSVFKLSVAQLNITIWRIVMKRYVISLLVFLAGFCLATVVSGGNLMNFVDIPTFFIVGLFPFLFTSVLFGFREMKAAYTTALQKELDVDRISKSQGFFDVFGTAIWIMGMIGTLIGFVAMLSNLDDTSSIGPNIALSILSIFYSGMLYLIAVLPFTLFLKKKQKAQLADKG
jgi:flagellar motor component MotA